MKVDREIKKYFQEQYNAAPAPDQKVFFNITGSDAKQEEKGPAGQKLFPLLFPQCAAFILGVGLLCLTHFIPFRGLDARRVWDNTTSIGVTLHTNSKEVKLYFEDKARMKFNQKT